MRPNGGGRSSEWELREGLESEDAGSLVLNGIMSGDESAQRATSDAIGTSDPVLDGASLIWGDVLVIH